MYQVAVMANVDLEKIQGVFNNLYTVLLYAIIAIIVFYTLISILNAISLSMGAIHQSSKLYANDYKIPNYKMYPFSFLEYLYNDGCWSGEPASFFWQQSYVMIAFAIMIFVLGFVVLNMLLYGVVLLSGFDRQKQGSMNPTNNPLIPLMVLCIVCVGIAVVLYQQVFRTKVYNPLEEFKKRLDDIDNKVKEHLVDSPSVLMKAVDSNDPERVLKSHWEAKRSSNRDDKEKIIKTINIIKHFKESNKEFSMDRDDYKEYFKDPEKSKFSFVGFTNTMYPFIPKMSSKEIEKFFEEEGQEISQINDNIRKDLEDIEKDMIAFRNEHYGSVGYIEYSLINMIVLTTVFMVGGIYANVIKAENVYRGIDWVTSLFTSTKRG